MWKRYDAGITGLLDPNSSYIGNGILHLVELFFSSKIGFVFV